MNNIIAVFKSGEEGKFATIIFFVIFLAATLFCFGVFMPFAISYPNTLVVIFGVLAPLVYGLFVYNLYKIFFLGRDNIL